MSTRANALFRVARWSFAASLLLGVVTCTTPTLNQELAIEEPPPVLATPAAGDVASNGSVSLMVWSNSGRVLGARLDSAGTALDSAALVLGEGGFHSTPPAIASAGDRFLVVWSTGPDLRFVFVSASGAISAPTRIANAYYGSFDVAAHAQGYYVAWKSDDVIRGTRISLTGQVLEPEGTVLGGVALGGKPAVTALASSYFVTWPALRTSPDIWGTDLHGVRVSVSTGVATQPSVVASPPPDLPPQSLSYDLEHPAVTFNGQLGLLTWLNPSGLRARRLDADGTLRDGPNGFYVASYVDTPNVEYRDVVSDGHDFLLLVSPHTVVRISSGAQVLDSPPLALPSGGTLPSRLTFNGSQYLAVKTPDARHLVSSAGQVTSLGGLELTIPAQQFRPQLAALPSGFGLMFHGDTGQRVLRLDSAGAPVVGVNTLPYSEHFAANATQLGLAGTIVRLRQGVPYAQAHLVDPAALTQTAAREYAAFTRSVGIAGNEDQFAVLVYEGASMVWIVRSDGSESSRTPVRDGAVLSIARAGSNYLTLWNDSDNRLLGARVARDGTLLDAAPLLIAQRSLAPANPRAASGATSSLVIWQEGGTAIYGALLNHDGTVGSAGVFPIALGSSSKGGPTVTFSAPNYAVVWRDMSGPAGALDLFGVRVSAEGVVLDSSPVRLTDYGDIGYFDVAPASSGTWLVAYDRFISGARRVRAKFTNLTAPPAE